MLFANAQGGLIAMSRCPALIKEKILCLNSPIFILDGVYTRSICFLSTEFPPFISKRTFLLSFSVSVCVKKISKSFLIIKSISLADKYSFCNYFGGNTLLSLMIIGARVRMIPTNKIITDQKE